MSSYEKVDALIGWIRTFDPSFLSEDDVEENIQFTIISLERVR
jgi:hypothetical protein